MAIKIQGVSVLRDEIESDTFDTTTDNLQNIRDELVVVDTEVGAIQGDVTSIETKVDTIDTVVDSVQVDTTSIEAKIDIIDPIVDSIQTDTTSIEAKIDIIDPIVDSIQTDVTALDTKLSVIEDNNAGTFDPTTDSLEKIRDAIDAIQGEERYKVVSVVSAANAGYVTLGTVTTGNVTIQSVIVHSDAAAPTQVDLTSCGVTGGDGSASDPVIFLDVKDAKKTNLDDKYEQVAWTGEVYLPVGAKISMNLVGTGATVVDLTVAIRFMATSLTTPGTLG